MTTHQEDTMTEYEPTEAEIHDALAFVRSQRGGSVEGIARALKARDERVRAEERAKRLDTDALERAIMAGFRSAARSETSGKLPRVTPMEGIRDAVLALDALAREEPKR